LYSFQLEEFKFPPKTLGDSLHESIIDIRKQQLDFLLQQIITTPIIDSPLFLNFVTLPYPQFHELYKQHQLQQLEQPQQQMATHSEIGIEASCFSVLIDEYSSNSESNQTKNLLTNLAVQVQEPQQNEDGEIHDKTEKDHQKKKKSGTPGRSRSKSSPAVPSDPVHRNRSHSHGDSLPTSCYLDNSKVRDVSSERC